MNFVLISFCFFNTVKYNSSFTSAVHCWQILFQLILSQVFYNGVFRWACVPTCMLTGEFLPWPFELLRTLFRIQIDSHVHVDD